MNGTTYTVMVEKEHEPGRMTSATLPYQQRASAFKRARIIAAQVTPRRVTVWEFSGPGTSKVHQVTQ